MKMHKMKCFLTLSITQMIFNLNKNNAENKEFQSKLIDLKITMKQIKTRCLGFN